MDQSDRSSPYLTRVEAAAYLKMSPFTLSNWGVKGVGPKFTKAGRKALYRIVDLEAFLHQDLAS
jgi:hypothetical protein